jgi:hypothetical protein
MFDLEMCEKYDLIYDGLRKVGLSDDIIEYNILSHLFVDEIKFYERSFLLNHYRGEEIESYRLFTNYLKKEMWKEEVKSFNGLFEVGKDIYLHFKQNLISERKYYEEDKYELDEICNNKIEIMEISSEERYYECMCYRFEIDNEPKIVIWENEMRS